ncbi:RNA 3'-terminal phosphate cyclase [Natronosalvus halobius]|uniref:RNA 3'-terminal phosphate cyclase n=1 Tax=Natronosalvus halobius TaxID=2953746 RepID=UPI0020A1E0AE|nr:RNA 3'-terminal phosphate cyclase [Natronosalvus halobius]USZ71563.1 RNA 3'-terminal phosphate cyclase [Natronosalvus halobius]
MHTLDGHDAGGQFLRRALTLSALTGESVRLEHVRGDRPNPGLANQHLAVLETMAAITDAEVSGAELESETVEFDPRTGTGGDGAVEISGGEYAVDVGTAGSLTLLFDAVLPLATRLESPLTLTATGGTDVTWSPPVDYLRYVKLPLLRRHGLQAALDVDRRGFYPVGGGRLRLHLAPSRFELLDFETRGDLAGVRVYSTEAAALADADVAQRQAEGALERLRNRIGADGANVEVRERVETTAESACPGSVIVLGLEFEFADDSPATTLTSHSRAGFSSLGEPGKPAERVGEEAANAAVTFLEGNGSVDAHLADQLLDFLVLGGGRLRIPAVTEHVETSLRLLEAFGSDSDSDFDLDLERWKNDDGSTLLVAGSELE